MTLLDGKKLKEHMIKELKEKIDNNNLKLTLTVVQIGDDEASNIYIKSKKRLMKELGFDLKLIHLDETVSEDDIISLIHNLNHDDRIDGILVQLPIPKKYNSRRILDSIDEKKDIDGLTSSNMGKLVHNIDSIVSSTAMGVFDLLKFYHISVAGKCVVIVGRSDLVGKPLSCLMINHNATVVLCHSNTNHLERYTKQADILIVAIGKPKFITKDMVKENAVVIDVGINKIKNGIVGDVDFDEVKNVTSFITPVPGGVGQLTAIELAKNMYRAFVFKKNTF